MKEFSIKSPLSEKLAQHSYRSAQKDSDNELYTLGIRIDDPSGSGSLIPVEAIPFELPAVDGDGEIAFPAMIFSSPETDVVDGGRRLGIAGRIAFISYNLTNQTGKITSGQTPKR